MGDAESVSPCGEIHFQACLLSCEEENRNLAFVVRVLELMILISLAEKERKSNISILTDVVGVWYGRLMCATHTRYWRKEAWRMRTSLCSCMMILHITQKIHTQALSSTTLKVVMSTMGFPRYVLDPRPLQNNFFLLECLELSFLYSWNFPCMPWDQWRCKLSLKCAPQKELYFCMKWY